MRSKRLIVFSGFTVFLLLVGGGYFVGRGLQSRRGPTIPRLPDLSGTGKAVAERIRSVYTDLKNVPTEKQWARYANILFVHGRYEEALRAYLVAAELSDNPFDYYYLAGQSIRTSDPVRAIQLFEEALRHGDGYMPLHVFLGKCYLAVGRLEEAEARFQAARKIENTSHALLGLAQVALRGDDVPSAISLLEEARKNEPRHTEVYRVLAGAYGRVGERSKAREAAALAPDGDSWRLNDPILNNLGDVAVNYSSFYSRGYNLFAAGRYKEALRFIEKGLEIRPDYPDALLLKARSLFADGQLTLAERAIDKLLGTQRIPDAISMKAHFLLRRRDLKEAYAILQESYGLDSQHVDTHYLLGKVFLQTNPPLAEIHLEFVIKQKPNDTQARLLYAALLFDQGRKDKARTQVLSILEQEPENRFAKSLLARIGD